MRGPHDPTTATDRGLLAGLDSASPWLIGIAIVGLGAWAAATLPLQALGILGGSAALAYVAWLRTGYHRPVRSRATIAAYLAAVSFQIIHLSEEWSQDFPHEFTILAGSDRSWVLDDFLAVFVFAAGALWVLAGAGALLGSRAANYFLWFYALGAGLINAIAHVAMPLLDGGYFPGLVTAPGHLVLSVLLIRLLVVEDRALRAVGSDDPGRVGAEPSPIPAGCAGGMASEGADGQVDHAEPVALVASR